jgi:hypothetical protein
VHALDGRTGAALNAVVIREVAGSNPSTHGMLARLSWCAASQIAVRGALFVLYAPDLACAVLVAFVTSGVNLGPMKRLRIASFVALFALVVAIPAAADDAFPPPKPHVGFYVVHPRVGLSTYFSLSSSWAGTQTPVHVVAKLHASGETCGSDRASDTGKPFASGWLTRSDDHVVWKEWTPAAAGSYIVCTGWGTPRLRQARVASRWNRIKPESRPLDRSSQR